MRVWKSVFAIWLFFWIFFLARGLYKGELEEYRTLLIRPAEERRAYIIGDELYNFLNFSLANISEDAHYQLTGTLYDIDRYRLIYYLYPRRESVYPEYILCYKAKEDFRRDGFYTFTVLKEGQFILKRRKD